ncbi:MAG: GntR family transcriptional regulator [Phycisphaeraceae bacterium]|nr:GntR family transcriptional regulator [Phycisphaeraceae bacterium]
MSRQTSNLRHEAYTAIRDMLLDGEWSGGDRLSTLQLSRQLGLSRTPVREAVAQLASEGLIHQSPRRGARVPVVTAEELREMYDLRLVLECFAVSEAASHINAEELNQLEVCCDRWLLLIRQVRRTDSQQMARKQWQEWVNIDEHYHRVIYAASRNKLLFKTLIDLRLLSRTMRMFRSGKPPIFDFSEAVLTYRHHRSLLRALAEGDSEAASGFMRQQILHGKQLHLAHLAESSEQSS